MSSTLSGPAKHESALKRVAILFAGGPAPGANAVISTAAASFQRNKIEVLGILHGYSSLADYTPEKPLSKGKPYIKLNNSVLKRTRSSQGIMIGTARTNPGKNISHPSHFDDPKLVAPLRRVYEGLMFARRRCAHQHRRRRHAQNGQQIQALSGSSARRCQTDPRRSSAQDDRQRLHGDRLHVRLFHGGRVPGRRDSQSAARCRGEPGVLPDRDDGPLRRLAVLWGGDCRRGEPGDQRRGHHRQLPRRAKRQPIPTAARPKPAT